ncbi:hypothetical protein GCM10028805_25260 [Spirosoma harenae]
MLKKTITRRRIKTITLLIELHDKLFLYPTLRKIYKAICPLPQFIIDVGANKGHSVDFFLSLNPACEIIAFEPIPYLYTKLVNKYSHLTNVKIYKLGVSNFSGSKLFYENNLMSTSTFEKINYSSLYTAQKANLLGIKTTDLISKSYEVSVVSLSDFLKTVSLKRTIDIIKIDVEGHEYSCLSGLFSDQDSLFSIKCLQLENHFNDQYQNQATIKQIIALLKKQGFSGYTKLPYFFGEFNEYIFYK